jgi:hypothetical protein
VAIMAHNSTLLVLRDKESVNFSNGIWTKRIK